MKVSELKGTFYLDVQRLNASLYKDMVEQNLFVANPSSVRLGNFIAGVGVTAVAVLFCFINVFAGVLIGAGMIAFAWFMPKRTSLGVEARWHARGFKLFLETAEKYRLQWQEKQNIFERYLPYAIAFGVADKWSKALAGLNRQPPQWYHGTYGSTFNSMVLWTSLNGMTNSFTRSFAPPAASGKSGFGGGGFSGGGFGGGGGGGW